MADTAVCANRCKKYNFCPYLIQVAAIKITTKMGGNVYLHHDGQFFQGNIRTKVRMEEGKIQFIDIDHHVS